MATKSQHAPAYATLLAVLRALGEGAGLTQRGLGGRPDNPQSWIHNCEVGNRRVDAARVRCGHTLAAVTEIYSRDVDKQLAPQAVKRFG